MAVPFTFAAGQWLNASDLNDLVAIFGGETGVNALATTSGTDTTTSATYVNLAGTGSVTSFSFTKVSSATRLLVAMHATFSVTTSNAAPMFGVRINGTDYDVTQMAPGSTSNNGTASGRQIISGISAGTYTIQGRWKRAAGSGTPTRTTLNDWLTITCKEIN